MLELVIEQRRRDLGGFEVGRVLPHAQRRMVGPFIFFDRIGPVVFPPGIPRTVDVRPHPHIGLSTITYLFAGEIMHRDSLGYEQPIRPGEVNWMTAGRGITHSERFEQARRVGGAMSGLQLWVALPNEHEEADPSFAHHGAAELPIFTEPGLSGRLIVGSSAGQRSPVHTYSPMSYVHWDMQDGTRLKLPEDYPERAVYVVEGTIETDNRRIGEGTMAIFASGAPAVVKALGRAVVVVLAGEPVGPRYIEWNFVSSSRERIEQAKADWRAGRMKLPDLDNGEFIPLPPDPQPAPNPMS